MHFPRLSSILSLDFWWNCLAGLGAMMCLSLGVGSLLALHMARTLANKRCTLLAGAWIVGFSALACWCFTRAGHAGFWMASIFPGLLTFRSGFLFMCGMMANALHRPRGKKKKGID